MSNVATAIIFHFHQPVDQFSWVNEEAYEKAYDPLLTSIERADGLKVHLHFTGPLLEWMEEYRPDFLDRVVKLVQEGRVSIVGGGYSEPILSMIPEEFRIIQIHRLRDWWKQRYNVDVRGCWLAERVWEPSLAKSLNSAGVEFIFIDDSFIIATGKNEQETYYTYFTEDEGKGVHVIPINEPIRYLIPWKPVDKTIDYLKQAVNEQGDSMVLIMSDAEKMGLWSAGKRTTHDICYGNGWDGKPWMDSFFSQIIDDPQIKSSLITEYMDNHNSRGLIYIPSASYDKMGTWVLPTDDRVRIEALLDQAKNKKIAHWEDILRFVKGSFWRNFLVKYPEVNIMHKRVFLSSNLYLKYRENLNGDEVVDEIIAAQSNDPYWHGMFGGAYYRFMRQSVFQHAIRAETMIRERFEPINGTTIESDDFLVNGRHEYLLRNKMLNVFISPFDGGTIYEIDDLSAAYNWNNVFTRRRESYHNGKFPVDRYIRRTLRDNILLPGVKREELRADTYAHISDISDTNYRAEIIDDGMAMIAESMIRMEDESCNISVDKRIQLNDQTIIINYHIRTEYSGELLFAPEFNFSLNSHPYKTDCELLGEQAETGAYLIDEGFDKFISEVKLIDDYANSQLSLKLENEQRIVSYPVITYSLTNKGSEEQYQNSCFQPLIKFSGELKYQIKLVIEKVNS